MKLTFRHFVIPATTAAIALAFSAHRKPYYAIDLKVAHKVQNSRSPELDRFMGSMNGVGYPFQVRLLVGGMAAILYALGLKWEAASSLFAGGGGLVLFYSLALLVRRPRPSADLVRMINEIPIPGFPSGHAVIFTAVFGFLWYRVYISTLSLILRAPLLFLLASIILLIGPARVYSGEHWASDVFAGYLIGSIWLASTIKFFQWGKRRAVGRN